MDSEGRKKMCHATGKHKVKVSTVDRVCSVVIEMFQLVSYDLIIELMLHDKRCLFKVRDANSVYVQRYLMSNVNVVLDISLVVH